jgi:uncharacterized membrane protein YgcG
MFRKTALFVALIFLLLGVLPGALVAQDRSIVWEDWDVDIFNINMTENSFQVIERYNVRFNGRFTFGTAVIEDNNLEAIRDVRVYEAGSPLQSSCSEAPGTYCVRQVQEGTSVTYYFNQPIADSTQNFEIHYTVIGALRVYEGGDQLWWTAIPDEHFGFPIERSTVTVQLPPGFAPREGVDPAVTYGAPAEITIDGETVIARATRRITGNESLEIRVQYPHDPNARKAGWQDAFDTRREFEETVGPIIDVGAIILGLLIAVGGTLAVVARWYTQGRDPEIGPVPQFLNEPPSDLPPAIVGTLVDEKADLRDVLSTIIDLGRRGYLVIEEEQKSGFMGIGGSSQFTFKRTDKGLDDLLDFEREVMRRVFHNRMERSLDSLRNSFYRYIPQLQKSLYKELLNHKLFKSNPETTRTIYTGGGVVLLILAGVLGFLGVGGMEEMGLSGTVLFVPISLGIVGVVLMIFGQHMPAKTREGAEEAAKWNAFREYLRNLEKYENLEDAADNFDKYLAYAVAFGIDQSWIRRFSKVSTAAVPIWYYPTYRGGHYSRGYRAGTPLSQNLGGGGLPSAADVTPGNLARAGGGGLDSMAGGMSGGLDSISSGLSNMLNSAARTMSSKPSSSGGGGFSGGGSRGGGSSGGGSRGFG